MPINTKSRPYAGIGYDSKRSLSYGTLFFNRSIPTIVRGYVFRRLRTLQQMPEMVRQTKIATGEELAKCMVRSYCMHEHWLSCMHLQQDTLGEVTNYTISSSERVNCSTISELSQHQTSWGYAKTSF